MSKFRHQQKEVDQISPVQKPLLLLIGSGFSSSAGSLEILVSLMYVGNIRLSSSVPSPCFHICIGIFPFPLRSPSFIMRASDRTETGMSAGQGRFH